MLKVGLLGAGRIGAVHAAAISTHPQSKLVAVSDVVADNASTLAAQYDCEHQSTESIINDESIDAVLIATSTDTHSDLIEAATATGKAVLCEKPLDLSLERARECQRVATQNGAPVMLGFNRRFDPNFAELKRSANAGDIGKSELLIINSFDPAPPPISYVKVSGGLFRDMMIHDFDMANFIMGDVPTTISAVGSSIIDAQIGEQNDVDTAVATLTYADGRIAVINNSRRAVYGYDQRLELLGSKGSLQVKNILENTVVKSTEQGITSAKPTYFFLERYMPAYKIEWSAFVESVISGTAVPVGIDAGVAALAMAEAATQSAQLGKMINLADV
jgi:myo-inositol 2-dehydrogenase/D-chiro-inositol 1-dehydrogenase